MIETIELADKTVILVGTAHISETSVTRVEDAIAEHEPDRVCVELDANRRESLENDTWGDRDIKEVLGDGDGYLLLFNLILSIYQRRLGEDVDIEPGAEMLRAIRTAQEDGLPVSLIDRDINITLKRAIKNLSWREKFRIFSKAIEGFFADEEIDIEEIEDEDMIYEIIESFAGSFPHLKETIIDERDHYMAQKLREADGDTIVAVVGAGHVAGIAAELRDNGVISIDELETIPQGPPIRKTIKYAVPALILGLFGYGLVAGGIGVAEEMLVYWFALNGVFGALGAIVAKAHPLTVLVTGLTAPFTSVNPALPAGLVSAYTENKLRPPRAEDLAAIGEITSIAELWTNTATKLLVIFFLVNMGSAIATFLGVGVIVQILQAV